MRIIKMADTIFVPSYATNANSYQCPMSGPMVTTDNGCRLLSYPPRLYMYRYIVSIAVLSAYGTVMVTLWGNASDST